MPAKPIKDGTLGLGRLEATTANGNAARIDAQKFEVDALAAGGAPGLRKGQQAGVNYLALDAGTEWSRPLRGNPRDVTFVSLNLHASIATVIEAGGAWVSVLQAEKPGRAVLVVGEPDATGALTWRKLGYESPRESFGGSEMAALPILTLRLDPASGTWDLYCGLRQVAAGLPLAPGTKTGAARQLTVRAGPAGVWLNAVAVSDANPLYPDANANGIDDAFETSAKGAPLATDASATERKALAADWQASQRRQPVPPVVAVRPLPDRLVAQMVAAEQAKLDSNDAGEARK